MKPKEKSKTLTALPPSPHWGMTFTRVLNPFQGLIGSRSKASPPRASATALGTTRIVGGRHGTRNANLLYISRMDLTLILGGLLLLVWGGLTVTTDAPGWVHLLLTAGVFLIIWRIVVRGTPSGPTRK